MTQPRLVDAEVDADRQRIHVREQHLWDDGDRLPVTDAHDWEIAPVRDRREAAAECAEALDVVRLNYHDDGECRLRCWVETFIEPPRRT